MPCSLRWRVVTLKGTSGSASRQPHSLRPPPDGRTCNLQRRKEKMRERPLLNLRKLCATGAGGVLKGSSADRETGRGWPENIIIFQMNLAAKQQR